MAEQKTSLKDRKRAAALGCPPTGIVIGSRITQLTDLDTDLAALADMSLTAIRARWQEVSDKPVPRVRQTLLRLALAYELQAAVHGGLSRRTEAVPPEPHSLVADVDAAFEQQILHVPQR